MKQLLVALALIIRNRRPALAGRTAATIARTHNTTASATTVRWTAAGVTR